MSVAVLAFALAAVPWSSGSAASFAEGTHAGRAVFSALLPPTRAHAGGCGITPRLVCTQVTVPLDRSGRVPGSISLHVEELPPDGVVRGVMFLIAGGPGQGSAHVFSIGDAAAASLYRYLFPGYVLVAYDDRGTGASGLLNCPALQAANTVDTERAAARDCGNSLGATAGFYGTADHVEDLDAVRQALGFPKIGLYGVSYGTKLAMAYALAHPDHVDRLLLDSVLPPELPDPYGSDVLRTLPSTLAAFCAAGCNAGTFASDTVTVANRLGAKPLQGKVQVARGRVITKRVDGIEILSIVLDADLNPGLAAELPAVVHAARLGNTRPLLRLAALHDAANIEDSVDLSFALYAATVCRDGPFPWQPDTPVVDRPALLQAAVAALPPGTLGPFGRWAASFGNADFCQGWPGQTGPIGLGAGPLPDVPMLAVSGGFDMRTPTAGASSVVARFPQGHLLLVPGVGHSTVSADPSGCAANAVHSWMVGEAVPSTCPTQKPLVAPVSALPPPGSAHPSRPASPRATYAIATRTLEDAKAIWLMTAGSSAAVPGVFGGSLVSGGRRFKLIGYSDARGVTLSGTLRLKKLGAPLDFQGTITVGGAAAAHGVLGVVGTSVRGTLGGSSVG